MHTGVSVLRVKVGLYVEKNLKNSYCSLYGDIASAVFVKFELFCILRLMIIQRLDLQSISQIKAGFVDRNIIDLKLLISAWTYW